MSGRRAEQMVTGGAGDGLGSRSRRPSRWRALAAALAPSGDFGRAKGMGGQGGQRRSPARRERGVALIIVITALTILAVLITDLGESTSTSYAIARSQRDRLQAEYAAKSALNLTRLLVANEPQIRQSVAPLYQMMVGRPPPQLPVWKVANDVLAPFCNYDQALGTAHGAGIDLANATGVGRQAASCEVAAVAENAKININDPLLLDGAAARKSVAMQVFGLLGGYQSPSPYDPIFSNRDPDGQFTSRLDVLSAMIDWWDEDTERTVFDPGSAEVNSGGGEDDIYGRFADPYEAKNAPFDSLEELRLVRGVGDDFWATFVEPDPDNLDSRALTIYGSGAVNPNEAPPAVLLARVCSYLTDQPLCTDPSEAAKFIQILDTARSMIPVPFFTRSSDFLAFLEGRGGPQDLYPMLRTMLGAENPLLFRPVTIPNDKRTEIDRSFVTAARILTIEATGMAGTSQVRIRAVLNFHDRWSPPPPNAGRMPPLGIIQHYRVD